MSASTDPAHRGWMRHRDDTGRLCRVVITGLGAVVVEQLDGLDALGGERWSMVILSTLDGAEIAEIVALTVADGDLVTPEPAEAAP